MVGSQAGISVPVQGRMCDDHASGSVRHSAWPRLVVRQESAGCSTADRDALRFRGESNIKLI